MKEEQTREIYKNTGAIIVQTGGASRFLGRLSFEVDPDSHAIKSFDVEHIASTSATGEHQATAEFLKDLYSRYMPNAKQPAGKIDKRIELYNMGYWYSDFIKNKSGSEIVLLPRDTLYDEHSSFKAKRLTMEDLFAMLYNRYLIKSTVTGEELLKYCDAEKMRHRFNPFHDKGRPFSGDAFYYSGFDVTFDSATQGVEFSIDAKKTYTLVTPWPYSSSEIRRYRHVLPERSVVDLKKPVLGLTVKNAEFLAPTTWQLLSAEVNQRPLTFPEKYSEPPACWKPWTAFFESKMKKQSAP
jgi:2',3'-cyclic-nucleotide 2'-phosphodiesterase (5'-nucleotidase family)